MQRDQYVFQIQEVKNTDMSENSAGIVTNYSLLLPIYSHQRDSPPSTTSGHSCWPPVSFFFWGGNLCLFIQTNWKKQNKLWPSPFLLIYPTVPLRSSVLPPPFSSVADQQSPPFVQLDDTHLYLAWLSRSSFQLPPRPYMGEDGEREGKSAWPREGVKSRFSFDLDRTDVSGSEWPFTSLFPGRMRKSNNVSLYDGNYHITSWKSTRSTSPTNPSSLALKGKLLHNQQPVWLFVGLFILNGWGGHPYPSTSTYLYVAVKCDLSIYDYS